MSRDPWPPLQRFTSAYYVRGLPRALWIARRCFATGSFRLPNLLRMHVDPDDYFQWMAVWGYFGSEIERLILETLDLGDTFVDVGANVGLFSLAARKAVGADGRVLAIEPDPRAREELEANLRLNAFGDVSVVDCAVGAGSGTLTLRLAKQLGHSTAVADFTGIDTVREVVVPVMALDDVLRQARVPVTSVRLVKIDVEGLEYEVLRGAEEVLRSASVMIMEVNHHALAANGRSFADLWEIIVAARRSPLWIERSSALIHRNAKARLVPISHPRDVEGRSGDIFIASAQIRE